MGEENVSAVLRVWICILCPVNILYISQLPGGQVMDSCRKWVIGGGEGPILAEGLMSCVQRRRAQCGETDPQNNVKSCGTWIFTSRSLPHDPLLQSCMSFIAFPFQPCYTENHRLMLECITSFTHRDFTFSVPAVVSTSFSCTSLFSLMLQLTALLSYSSGHQVGKDSVRE